MTNAWFLDMGAVAVLLIVGFYCLFTQRNLIKLFIGVEILGKAATLAMMATGLEKKNVLVAQCLAITIIVVEVCVIAVALAMIINMYRHTGSLDIRKLTKLKG